MVSLPCPDTGATAKLFSQPALPLGSLQHPLLASVLPKSRERACPGHFLPQEGSASGKGRLSGQASKGGLSPAWSLDPSSPICLDRCLSLWARKDALILVTEYALQNMPAAAWSHSLAVCRNLPDQLICPSQKEPLAVQTCAVQGLRFHTFQKPSIC